MSPVDMTADIMRAIRDANGAVKAPVTVAQIAWMRKAIAADLPQGTTVHIEIESETAILVTVHVEVKGAVVSLSKHRVFLPTW